MEQLLGSSTRGVLIVGSPGTGKTWMLGQIISALGPDAFTLRLTASKALAAIPFGTVNARVGSNLLRSSQYYEVLNGLLEQIEEANHSSRSVYLLVDNAQYLDDESAAVILQVVLSTEAKLILVDQPGNYQGSLRQLWRDGYLTRFELSPLQTHDVRLYLEEFLGGRVAGATIEYLTSRSAGNPLVLQGLIEGAREEGSLQEINGVWVLNHPADSLSQESQELLRMELEHLPPESRMVVEILALAGPLPVDVVLGLSGPQTIDDLQKRDVVALIPGTHLTIQLARAATAPPIRAMVPVGRSRQFFAQVNHLVPEDVQQLPNSLINFTRWSLGCGLPVTEERLLQAAVWANRLMRPHEALRLTVNKPSQEKASFFLTQRAIAHLNCNLPAEAQRLAQRALEAAATPAAGAQALHAIHLSYSSDPNYEAHFAKSRSEYANRFGLAEVDNIFDRVDIDVHTVLALSEVSVGNIAGTCEKIETLLRHPLAESVTDQVLLKSLLCEIYRATGQMSKAVKLADEVIGGLERPGGFPRPDIAILAYSRAVAAYIYDGAWEHVRLALDPATFVNPDLLLYAGGLRDLAAAMMHCRRGHIEQALSALESAVGALNDYDPWSVMSTALSLKAYCQVMRGDVVGSQSSLALLENLTRRSAKFYALEAAAYAAAAQFMTGQSEQGMTRLRALQRQCLSNGYLGIELTVLSLMVRVGDVAAMGRLAEVAQLLDSSGKEFFVHWSAALRTQDPAELDHASGMAMDYGFELLAVELATHALKKFHAGGKVQKSRRTASKVEAMRDRMPGLVSPVFHSIDQPKMTRREHQIALLVAQGESNNSIAARLQVSLRTVEGHLYRTFIKLDIQSREQLAALMDQEATKITASADLS
ncbi:LuxR C-terminal-related transcriptional regulator [Specibacter sp. NPDC057265]|uniref:LuxR C-terminal-related transcriptional regulator n=1 Tax=Specibacter sp. NPDC057265 TaxID=3346075 RepID=UPI0036339D64